MKRGSRPLRGAAERCLALREPQALAACGPHPWIVGYHSCWMEEERLHIQLELCGRAASRRVGAGQPLDSAGVVSLLSCVASALAHLHRSGLAHMDVKPDNIFEAAPWVGGSAAVPPRSAATLLLPPHPPRFKLGDLGNACRMGSAPAADGDCRYLCNELLRGCFGSLDRADVFALGLSAVELATGAPLPKEGQAYKDMRNGRLGRLPASMSAPLQDLLRKCANAFPANRPSAEALAAHPALLAPGGGGEADKMSP